MAKAMPACNSCQYSFTQSGCDTHTMPKNGANFGDSSLFMSAILLFCLWFLLELVESTAVVAGVVAMIDKMLVTLGCR